ncbi:MAG: type I methionyl aminopeptidase [Chthonomonadales bacterium]
MIVLKTSEEIVKMRAAGAVVYEALQAMKAAIEPGVSTTNDLEMAAVKVMAAHGADSAFLGYAPHGHPPYPAYTCISVNEAVVHGIPGRRVLQNGDIVSCDVGVRLNGYYADSAWTFPVGPISDEVDRLLKVTEESLYKGLEKAKHGARLGDVSNAIEKWAKRGGFSVVKEMVGHGVGRQLHEEPQIPNYGHPGTGPVLKEGMTLAIEPMVNQGKAGIVALDDDWTVVTCDRKWSAHFEHTVAITKSGAVILTQGV